MEQNGARSPEPRGLTHHSAETDALIGRLAAKQEGRVSRLQLLERGVGPKAIDRRLALGRLLLERPGVYRVAGAAVGDSRARCAIALLDAGPGSAVSWFSAAAEWRMRLPSPQVVHITNPRPLRSRDGIRLHRREIHPVEMRHPDGLPITSPAQTVFDLSAVLGLPSLGKVANQGFVERVLTLGDLRTVLVRNEGRKGAPRFRRLLDRLDPEGRRVRSPLETLLHDFLRARGFPPWESNVRLRIGEETIEPDVLWREQRVIVEADGRDPHLAPLTFDSDRRRDRRCRVERWEPVRVTWADLDERPDELESDIRSLLNL